MIILHSRKLIFIRSHKTASTSIEAFMRQHAEKGDIATPDRFEGWFGIGDYKPFRPHGTANEIKDKIPDVWKEYTKFTVDRNPWEKTYSEYSWRRRAKLPDGSKPSNMADVETLSFSEFVKNKRTFTLNYKSYMDNRNNVIVDYVVPYENLNECLKKIFSQCGIEFNGLTERKKSAPNNENSLYRNHYDDEMISIISSVHYPSIEYFGYVFSTRTPKKNKDVFVKRKK